MKKISIRQILKEKKPALSGFVPDFVINYLGRTVHLDKINYTFEHFGSYPPLDFIRSTLAYMDVSYDIHGLENIDPAGRYIFASNHPFGGMDGMMLAEKIGRYFGDVRVIVNDILMNIPPLRPIFIPVNKFGRQSGAYAQAFYDAFASQMPILTFPAGLCSRRINGRVQDTQWKTSFVKRAVESQRDVVPTFVEGELSSFFYRLSSWRKRLGLKLNVEMVYLPDEMFSQAGHHFDIYVGKPVRWQTLSSMGNPRAQTEEIRRRVYALSESCKCK